MSIDSDQTKGETLSKNYKVAIFFLALIPFLLATVLSYCLAFGPERYSLEIFTAEVILVAVLWGTTIILMMIGTRPPNPKPPLPSE